MRAASALVSIFVLLLAGATLGAQEQRADSTRALAGTVRDAATHQPIAGATITASTGSVATTDGRGAFAVRVPSTRRLVIHVRRLGYDSLSAVVDAFGSGRLELELRPAAVGLDTVTVAARTRNWPSKVDDFERRLAHHHGGVFFTRTDIERHQPIVTSDLVRLAIGVKVMDSLGVRLFASARGDKVVDGPYGRRSVPCIMRVGVDGQIMEWGFAADNVPPSDIYGIEVYQGPGSIPREYASQVTDAYCGLVMIWTR